MKKMVTAVKENSETVDTQYKHRSWELLFNSSIFLFFELTNSENPAL